jgi:mono/diheme cytochrome c family protein
VSERCTDWSFATSCMLVVMLATGCDEEVNMAEQPRVRTLQPSPVFEDGASARPLVEGVVSTDGVCFTNAPEKTSPPPPLTVDLLMRGREVFHISCVPCHGEAGYGDGMVVQRGYPQPPSYHTKRLRAVSDRHIFRVITEGLGKMPPYADQVPDPQDRWALVGYVRALQLSQHGDLSDVPEPVRQGLDQDASTNAPSTAAIPDNATATEEHP